MKQFTGKVISTKMQETAVVLIERQWRHPLYKKIIRGSKKYLVDNKLAAKKGDRVIIQECRPISKRKTFKIVKILKN